MQPGDFRWGSPISSFGTSDVFSSLIAYIKLKAPAPLILLSLHNDAVSAIAQAIYFIWVVTFQSDYQW